MSSLRKSWTLSDLQDSSSYRSNDSTNSNNDLSVSPPLASPALERHIKKQRSSYVQNNTESTIQFVYWNHLKPFTNEHLHIQIRPNEKIKVPTTTSCSNEYSIKINGDFVCLFTLSFDNCLESSYMYTNSHEFGYYPSNKHLFIISQK